MIVQARPAKLIRNTDARIAIRKWPASHGAAVRNWKAATAESAIQSRSPARMTCRATLGLISRLILFWLKCWPLGIVAGYMLGVGIESTMNCFEKFGRGNPGGYSHPSAPTPGAP